MKRIVLLFTTALFVATGFAQTQPVDSTAKKPVDSTLSKPASATKRKKDRSKSGVSNNAADHPVSMAAATPPKKKKDWSKVNLNNRPGDHLLVQVGYDGWANRPDTIHTKGFSRSLNIYLMFDFPFKTDPRFSVGVGAGIGSSSIFFDKQQVGVASTTGNLAFPDGSVTNTNYFKKYKLVSTYLEAPVELRFAADPEHIDKSWKGALGVKVGTLLNIHTKGKNYVTSSGTINYTEKQASKQYFSGTRLAATARIGYGHISLFGQIQVNNYIKEGVGPNVVPFSIGITFSGL